eukprot:TRINITY_DN50204_c0_g1_i1.p1 TRINITY_DN50204_c0_g1~~TRINITY_DN50204_c0_g1_i1.p1  ORF type:complete len:248 (-),score=30.88 TRINITY_DN50204_c0_g1_i1:282-1025(-)
MHPLASFHVGLQSVVSATETGCACQCSLQDAVLTVEWTVCVRMKPLLNARARLMVPASRLCLVELKETGRRKTMASLRLEVAPSLDMGFQDAARCVGNRLRRKTSGPTRWHGDCPTGNAALSPILRKELLHAEEIRVVFLRTRKEVEQLLKPLQSKEVGEPEVEQLHDDISPTPPRTSRVRTSHASPSFDRLAEWLSNSIDRHTPKKSQDASCKRPAETPQEKPLRALPRLASDTDMASNKHKRDYV